MTVLNNTTIDDDPTTWTLPENSDGGAFTRWVRRNRNPLFALLGMVLWLGCWQISASLGLVDVLFSSSPFRMVAATVEFFRTGEILPAIAATGYVFLVGMGISIVVGIPLGLLLGRSHVLHNLTELIISILYSVPFVLFLPMIIFWFGIDDMARIVIVIWAAILPLIINVRVGARNLDEDYIRVATVFCIPRTAFFYRVSLPATLPFIFAGLRLAIGRALVGVIVAEFFLGSSGLGFYVQVQTANLNMDGAMGAILLLAIAAVLLNSAIKFLERRFIHWKGEK